MHCRKLSPVQLREFGARALVPRSLTREKKLPDWQLNEDLLRCALHPGFPITVDATCDDVPRKLTVVRRHVQQLVAVKAAS
jgi:hypothetical protein